MPDAIDFIPGINRGVGRWGVDCSGQFVGASSFFFLSISTLIVCCKSTQLKMVYIKNLAQTALFASAVSAFSVIGRRQNPTGLNAAFVGHDKLYWGTCSDQALLQDTQNSAVIKANFRQLTPENSMKWDAIERRLLSRGGWVIAD